MKYKDIRDGINNSKKKGLQWIVELEDLKLIVFSDHHRGKRDGADDFLPCEKTYLKALNYYLKNGYALLLLGDVEELWENSAGEVMQSYKNVLFAEREFHLRNRFIKIWGNHDDMWQFPNKVKAHFKNIFPGLQVFESVDLEIHQQGEILGNILFVHGHQGTMMSSKFANISKFFVRYFWRPAQRLFKIPVSTAAKHEGLRNKTDYAMDLWAGIRKRQLIVCGHTHQYIFGSYVLDKPDSKPCYFNTGCCSYGNGNISGLEISNQKIRIIEWKAEDSEPYYVTKAPLTELFQRCM